MIKAAIHGKLPELEYLEDALTSTVFGRLRYLPPGDALIPFLEKAICYSQPRITLKQYLAGHNARPWYWEGNVQAALVAHLVSEGYSIRSVSDTETRAQGKDIIAISPDGRELWVSVKGFPENSPNTQARHWFSGAVFDLVLYHGENPDVSLALGLPDGFHTYKGLASPRQVAQGINAF